jgi:hypothetical protein
VTNLSASPGVRETEKKPTLSFVAKLLGSTAPIELVADAAPWFVGLPPACERRRNAMC